MNPNSVVSFNAANSTSLQGKEGLAVKLESTGVSLAGPADRAIGTIIRGPLEGTTNGAVAVFLKSEGLRYVTIANATAIAVGDLLELVTGGKVQKLAARAGTATASTDVVNVTGHGLVNGQLVTITALTGGTGLALGGRYYVRDSAENTFKVALVSGGAAVDITADASAISVTPEAFAIAVEAAPSSSADGQIRAVLV